MAHLLFDVKGQSIIRKDTFFAVEKSVNYLTAKFNLLSEEWTGTTVTAVFTREDDSSIVKYAILDDNNECLVPYEVLQKSGNVFVSLFAGSSEIVTTNYANVFLYPSGYAEGEEALDPPSPDAYEQMTDYFNESRIQVREDKEFVAEAVEKFSHINGGTFVSDDWTGEETENDPQNATIQVRTGSETAFDGEKLLVGEFAISDASKVRVKDPINRVIELTNKSDFDNVVEDIEVIRGIQNTNTDAINTISKTAQRYDTNSPTYVVDLEVGDDGCIYGVNEYGERVTRGVDGINGGGGSGGGGGTSTSNFPMFTVTSYEGNTNVTFEKETTGIHISVNWQSTDSETGEITGYGYYKLFKSGTALTSNVPIPQGNVDIIVDNYMDDGDNSFRLTITDANNISRSKVFNYTKADISLTSTFDERVAQEGSFVYKCTPVGLFDKWIHYEMDDVEIHVSDTIKTSRQPVSYTIPAQSHGKHTLRVWCEANVNGVMVSTTPLEYNIICVESESTERVVAIHTKLSEVSQYTKPSIEFNVYDPRSYTTGATIIYKLTDEEGNVSTKTTVLSTVDRNTQSYDVRFDTVGTAEITILSGSAYDELTISVTQSPYDIAPVTDGMILHLSSEGRSNAEASRNSWTYGSVTSTFSGFDFNSNGWVQDDDGNTCLRIDKDARLTVNMNVCGTDFRNTGATLGFIYSTSNVLDKDTVVFQCLSGNRGFYATPTKFVLQYSSGQAEIPLRSDGQHSLYVTIEQETVSNDCLRLIRFYIDGMYCAVYRYSSGTIFSQGIPVPLTFGSEDCVLDLYDIRFYSTELNKRQVLSNFVADSADVDEMLERYERNDIYDDNGDIMVGKLDDGSFIIIDTLGQTLPKTKKDPGILVSGYVIFINEPEKSYAFYRAKLSVQGTSSEGYRIKNWFLEFVNGVTFLISGEHSDTITISDTGVGITKPCLKADMASSEGYFNNEDVAIYCNTTPFKTPYQLAELEKPETERKDIRIGIDGFPTRLFWANGDLDTAIGRGNLLSNEEVMQLSAEFGGRYNFNNDKGNFNMFGFQPGDESWEFKVNDGGLVLMLDGVNDDWEEITSSGDKFWETEFSGLYPKDNPDYSNFKPLIDWAKSVDVVTPQLSAEEKAAIGCTAATLTEEEINARLQKFHDELFDYMEHDAWIFDYMYDELTLSVDSLAKNRFYTKMGNSKWFTICYDRDTVWGYDNSGNRKFEYSAEIGDIVATFKNGFETTYRSVWPDEDIDISTASEVENVYNGQKNTLIVNTAHPTYGFMDEVDEMYRSFRASGKLTPEVFINAFINHVALYSEAEVTEDGIVKYEYALSKEGDAGYLRMLQGLKLEHILEVIPKRFHYLDSKHLAGYATANEVTLRTFKPRIGLTLTPSMDLYPSAIWGNGNAVMKRARAHVPTELPSSMSSATDGTDTVLQIPNSDSIEDFGDLSQNGIKTANFPSIASCKRLKLGDDDPNYDNGGFYALTVGYAPKLEEIDCTNCSGLGNTAIAGSTPTPEFLGSPNLKTALFDGTSIRGLSFVDGGKLETVHYPSTATEVRIRNHENLEELVVPNWAGVEIVELVNIGSTACDLKNLYTQIQNGATYTVGGFTWNAADAQEIEDWLAAIEAKSFQGTDNVNGVNVTVDHPVITCTINVPEMTGSQIASIHDRYPGITIRATQSSATVSFYNGDTFLKSVVSENGASVSYGDTSNVTKATDDVNTYAFAGWSRNRDAISPENDILESVTEDIIVYAVFTPTLREFNVRFYNGETLLETDTDVTYGSHPSYDSATPISATGRMFTGWTYDNNQFADDLSKVTVTKDMDFYASFLASHTVTFYNGSRKLQEVTVDHGSAASYGGTNPKSSTGAPFIGWSADNGTTVITNLASVPIFADTNFYAQFTPVYTVRFFKYAGDLSPLLTIENVIEHDDALYTGETVIGDHGEALLNWSPSNLDVTENRDCYAVFETLLKCEYYVGDTLFYTDNYLHYGDNSTCPNTPVVEGKKFAGWVPTPNNITKDTKVYATFGDTYYVKYFANEDDTEPIYTDSDLDPGDNSIFVGTLPTGEYGAPFVRWDPEPTNVQANMYVYAVYEPRYTVRYLSENGAQVYHTVNGVAPGDDVTYPSSATTPTKNGYEFIGWDPVPNNVQADVNCYAQFRKLHTVNFYVNGSLDATVSGVSDGSTVTYPNTTPVDSVSGGTFLGWAKDNLETGAVYSNLSNVSITADTDFYAKFSTAYVVTFYENDTDTTPYEVVKGVAPGGSATPTKGDPTKSGYEFTGWDPSPTNVNGNINVYAEWERVYTVRYLVDGTVVQSSSSVRSGAAYPFTGTTPTKSGYEFTGWLPTEPTNVTGDVDCVAQFIQLHTVRFMNGTTVLQTVNNVRHGADATYTGTTPTKEGYEFTGWSPTPTNITADTDCIAQFVEKPTEEALWNAVYASIDNNTYATDYPVDTKVQYKIGSTTYNAAVVGVDADDDENGGKIPLTFITEELYTTKYKMNNSDTNSGGYNASLMKTTNIPAIKALMPSYFSGRIVKAKKRSLLTDRTVQVTYEDVWIPSQYELNITGYEAEGPCYSTAFPDANSRIKKFNGSANTYWTRTAGPGGSNDFRRVDNSGGSSNNYANNANGVVLGFCIGKKDPKADWDELDAAITNDTYKTKYAVGDTLAYTDTDGTTFNAQIVAFDTDVDANGNTVPVSFILVEEQLDAKAMNASSTNSGGWSASAMRNTHVPAFKAKLPSYIISGIVPVKKYSLLTDSTTQETVDDVWIPSQYELGITGYETSGPTYSAVFNSASARIKKKNGSANTYWTRTANPGGSHGFRLVYDVGNSNNYDASYTIGVVLGFCYGQKAS